MAELKKELEERARLWREKKKPQVRLAIGLQRRGGFDLETYIFKDELTSQLKALEDKLSEISKALKQKLSK